MKFCITVLAWASFGRREGVERVVEGRRRMRASSVIGMAEG